MLVLTRKPGEEICIGEGILVRVLGMHGTRVKLGITCSRDLKVLRGELVGQAVPRTHCSVEAAVVSPSMTVDAEPDNRHHPLCCRTFA